MASKKNTLVPHEKRLLLDREDPALSIRKQCELLQVNRSGFYLSPCPETLQNLALMRLIDKIYLLYPFYGSRRISISLRSKGHQANRKRIQRLMRIMGIEAIYPKPKTSKGDVSHKKYPYLLKDMVVSRPNQAWCSDITYVPVNKGFFYLVAIMDWYSRHVLSWELSNSMETGFCLTALENALSSYGKPEIFNTDQGAQFTSNAFTQMLLEKEVNISMDGRGRCFDNIFIERLWRTVKYEEIYLNNYPNGDELYQGLKKYFSFYNNERPHMSLKNIPPIKVYLGKN